MYEIDLNIILLTGIISLAIALVSLWGFSHNLNGKKKSLHNMLTAGNEEIVFLFDDETLVDATTDAHRLLGVKSKGTTDWQRLLATFGDRFSTLADDLSMLGDAGTLTIVPDNPKDTAYFEAEWWNGIARLVFFDTENDTGGPLIEAENLAALENELEVLRGTAKLAPYLAWQETREGQIIWANAAYLSLSAVVKPENESSNWPPARMFESLVEVQNSTNAHLRRVSLKGPGKSDLHWYDLTSKQVNETAFFFATPADAIVHAETALKGFVQTLTKTFAHLSIGLAIFDRNRQLALFNPALTDLTALPIGFLSARPTLFALFDQLRENQMMPEPKDYKSWRQQMTALEAAATDGTYEEIWTLPNGLTYRVNGRPHPDGAVALLFEDISAEISLTRSFRAELEVGQAVMDTIDDAIVVFSSSGLITMSNTAYTALWGVDPGTSFGEMSVIDATRRWQEVCDPTPLWGDLRDFVGKVNERAEWFGEATLDDGRALACLFTPMSGGATLVKFRVQENTAKPAKPSGGQRKRAVSA